MICTKGQNMPRLAIGLLLLASVCQAAEQRVSYSLKCYAPGTGWKYKTSTGEITERLPAAVVSSVKAGDEFDLVMFVQDLRPEGEKISQRPPHIGEHVPLIRGVYAAYADVLYRKNLSMLVSPPLEAVDFKFNYGPRYHKPEIYAKLGEDLPDRIGAVGAINSTGPLGTDPVEVARVRMRALWPAGFITTQATAVFSLKFDKLAKPYFDSLLYGNIETTPPDYGTVKPDEIRATGTTVRIVK